LVFCDLHKIFRSGEEWSMLQIFPGGMRQINYFMHGRITGLRTLVGEDINYLEHLDVIGTSVGAPNK
jgi:hypothetical protein